MSKLLSGNYNPLMQRTFGYQTGQHPGAAPKSNAQVNTPDQRDQYVSPQGREYYGPGYGSPQPKGGEVRSMRDLPQGGFGGMDWGGAGRNYNTPNQRDQFVGPDGKLKKQRDKITITVH